jgi:hypothetical protein
MKAKQGLRSLIIVLFAAGMMAAQAGGEAMSATGRSLRESALLAARQRAVVETASREEASSGARSVPSGDVAINARSITSDPLSYTFKLNSTDVTLDFCSGAHLLMTSNLDSVTELIVHP